MKQQDLEEVRLVQRAQGGDPEAFTALYHSYQPKIYRFIFFRVEDAATAEDLTSEVFVRMVEHIDTFNHRGTPLLSWLYTIARNLLTDHYRRKARAAATQLDEDWGIGAEDPIPDIETAMLSEHLGAALAQLTEPQQDVILLKFFEDLDNATIARLLHTTIGAVKALQHRAMATLARYFAQLDIEDQESGTIVDESSDTESPIAKPVSRTSLPRYSKCKQ